MPVPAAFGTPIEDSDAIRAAVEALCESGDAERRAIERLADVATMSWW